MELHRSKHVRELELDGILQCRKMSMHRDTRKLDVDRQGCKHRRSSSHGNKQWRRPKRDTGGGAGVNAVRRLHQRSVAAHQSQAFSLQLDSAVAYRGPSLAVRGAEVSEACRTCLDEMQWSGGIADNVRSAIDRKTSNNLNRHSPWWGTVTLRRTVAEEGARLSLEECHPQPTWRMRVPLARISRMDRMDLTGCGEVRGCRVDQDVL